MLRRLTAAVVLVCCLLPAAANASGTDVIKDCSLHGRLTKKYTQKEYKDALARIPTDLDEYTDCRDRIRRAQLAASSGGNDNDDDNDNSDTSAGPIRDPYQGAGATPEESTQAQQEIVVAQRGGQRVPDLDVSPGALAYRDFGAVSKLPVPLVAFGTLLVVAALGVAVYLIRTRVRTDHLGA